MEALAENPTTHAVLDRIAIQRLSDEELGTLPECLEKEIEIERRLATTPIANRLTYQVITLWSKEKTSGLSAKEADTLSSALDGLRGCCYRATLWGCREELERALAKLEGAQAELVLESEPIHQVLALWLQDSGNRGREMEAGVLHRDLSKLAGEHQITWPFGNGKALGSALGHAETALREKFDFEIAWDAHTKQNRYSFRPKHPKAIAATTSPEPTIPAEPEEILELAGFAGFHPPKP